MKKRLAVRYWVIVKAEVSIYVARILKNVILLNASMMWVSTT